MAQKNDKKLDPSVKTVENGITTVDVSLKEDYRFIVGKKFMDIVAKHALPVSMKQFREELIDIIAQSNATTPYELSQEVDEKLYLANILYLLETSGSTEDINEHALDA